MPVVTFYDTKPYDREYIGTMLAKATGVELRLVEFRLTEASVETARGSAAVCLFVNDRADRAILAKLAAMGVKHIALRCAGFNNVDLLAARDVGIAVTRVPAYSPHAVAEHTIALLLTLNRKIHRAYNRVREHNFALAGLVGFDLHGKTVGIVGTGKIGRIVAQIFRGFDTRVLACDVAPDGAWAMTHGIGYTSLHELLAQSDIVSLHTPLTTATHHLINADTLALMKRGAYLVNTSRGKLVETAALIKALKSRQLGGVALDVYEEEEGVFFEDLSGVVLQDDELSRLLTFPNVLVTSHQAFLTAEALREIAFATVENLQRGFRGADFLPGTNLT